MALCYFWHILLGVWSQCNRRLHKDMDTRYALWEPSLKISCHIVFEARYLLLEDSKNEVIFLNDGHDCIRGFAPVPVETSLHVYVCRHLNIWKCTHLMPNDRLFREHLYLAKWSDMGDHVTYNELKSRSQGISHLNQKLLQYSSVTWDKSKLP